MLFRQLDIRDSNFLVRHNLEVLPDIWVEFSRSILTVSLFIFQTQKYFL